MSSMREQMPTVAAWIDDLREQFGAENIDPSIRAGMQGRPTFYAEENGHRVGTPVIEDRSALFEFTQAVLDTYARHAELLEQGGEHKGKGGPRER